MKSTLESHGQKSECLLFSTLLVSKYLKREFKQIFLNKFSRDWK